MTECATLHQKIDNVIISNKPCRFTYLSNTILSNYAPNKIMFLSKVKKKVKIREINKQIIMQIGSCREEGNNVEHPIVAREEISNSASVFFFSLG